MANDITMQIPIYNSPQSVAPLLDSLKSSGLADHLSKILFVNDASTDNTLEVLQDQKSTHALAEKIEIINLPNNMGRYYVNVEGVKAVDTQHLILTNCRAQFQPGFEKVIAEITLRPGLYSGSLFIDTNQSIYNLHWERLHRLIYKHIFEAYENGPFQITENNMASYLIGATVYLCPTEAYRKTTKLMPPGDVKGDDTTFLKNMMQVCPVFLDGRLAIKWEPRQSLWSYVYHFYERSPNFVEYHVLTKRTFLFGPFLLGLIVSLTTLAALALSPKLGALIIATEVVAIAASTLLIAKSPIEFVKMVWLHTACILFFGFGVLIAFTTQSATRLFTTAPSHTKEEPHE